MRSLDSELTSTINSSAIRALGLSIISAFAVLAGWHFGVAADKLISIGLPGAVGSLGHIAEIKSAIDKSKGHPFYFLWKAQQKLKQ